MATSYEEERAARAVRYLLVELSDVLTPRRIEWSAELLAAAEPELALEGIASELGPQRQDLPEHLVRFIRDEVGSLTRIPPAFLS